VLNVIVAREMGWTLDYVEGLGSERVERVLAILSGLNEKQ
jgi:hypothetical protein